MTNKNCKSYIIRTKRCLFAQKMVCVLLVLSSIPQVAGCSVWVTFKRATIQPHNPSTPQVNTPSTPSTSKREIAKAKRLKALLSAIGANGSNLRALMESMQRKDRKGFVSTYIVPNIEAGYIAMLYPEAPNHPMQSYYLTKKGRELLEHL